MLLTTEMYNDLKFYNFHFNTYYKKPQQKTNLVINAGKRIFKDIEAPVIFSCEMWKQVFGFLWSVVENIFEISFLVAYV